MKVGRSAWGDMGKMGSEKWGQSSVKREDMRREDTFVSSGRRLASELGWVQRGRHSSLDQGD